MWVRCTEIKPQKLAVWKKKLVKILVEGSIRDKL